MPGAMRTRRNQASWPASTGCGAGLAAIVAVGLRPCSGAIIVLVFALAQGLFWIGVASTFVMGLGTAITVAAVATLAVGARGFAGRLGEGKAWRRADRAARAGNRGGGFDRRVRRGLAHRLHDERADGIFYLLAKVVRLQFDRLAVRRAVAGVVPGIAIAMQCLLVVTPLSATIFSSAASQCA